MSLCSDHRWGDDPIHCALDLRFVAVVAGPAPAHLFAMQDILETLRDYYRQAAVRARMLEFLGADEAGDFTAE